MWVRDLNVVPAGAHFRPENIDPTTNRPYSKQFLVPYKGYNNVHFREWASSSNYHSLQVSANRRFVQGLQFGVSWTWSKSMDFNSGDLSVVSPIVPVRTRNCGLSSFDRTHVLKISWMWDLPRVSVSNRVLNHIFNNWQVSGIASVVSGQPLGVSFSTTTPVDFTGDAQSRCSCRRHRDPSTVEK